MAADTTFCFTFYPGDYLRDTNCLSPATQVVYDRMMCEHMRNTCITHEQHGFFTRKLTDEERMELNQVLTKVDGGYLIAWIADSIAKKRAYSASRAENRAGKKKIKGNNICESYDSHMEDENENRNRKGNSKEGIGGVGEKGEAFSTNSNFSNSKDIFIVPEMIGIFKQHNPGYVKQTEKDFPAARKIAELIADEESVHLEEESGFLVVKDVWETIVTFTAQDSFYKNFSLSQVEKHIQSIILKLRNAREEVVDGPVAGGMITHNLNAAALAMQILKSKRN